jgi:hypothetical protein
MHWDEEVERAFFIVAVSNIHANLGPMDVGATRSI